MRSARRESHPASPACCSRAATLTASPVANVESRSSATISPASTPILASSPSPVHRVEDRGGGTDRRARRRPRAPVGRRSGHNGIAGELLHDPPVRRRCSGRRARRNELTRRRDDLGIARSDKLRRADEIDEQDCRELAFHRVIVVTRVLGLAAPVGRQQRRERVRRGESRFEPVPPVRRSITVRRRAPLQA